MKIVVITRNIYPKITPRAFRSTELVKEFARIGHDVTVYSVLGKYDYTEFEQSTGVKVRPIKTHLATAASDGSYRYNFLDKVCFHSLNKLIEYPDIEFIWKVAGIIKEERDVDLLMTIAVPYPIHWGAAFAKKFYPKNFPKTWISDCGDPYMGNTVGKHFGYFNYIENFWGKQTDFISIPIEAGRLGYSSSIQDKIRVIPQAFNFDDTPIDQYQGNKIPTFAYAGSTYPGLRDLTTFLEHLKSLDTEFVFTIFVPNPDKYEVHKRDLDGRLEVRGYIPRYELIKVLSTQDFLINLKNPNAIQSPSKLIDYLISKRPIVDISTPFKEAEKIRACFAGDFPNDHRDDDVSQFDVRVIAQKFLELCNIHD